MKLFHSFRRRLPRLLLAALLLGVAGETLAKKIPAPAEAAAPAPVNPAQMRIWKGELGSGRSLRVSYTTSARKPVTKDFAHLEKGFAFGSYAPIPAEDLQIEIFEDTPTGAKLKSIPLHLAAADKATLLLSETDGKIGAEIVNDTPSPGTEATAELAVRNFVPSLTSLQVSVGDDVHVSLNTPQSFLQVRGLRREALEVDTAGTQAGKPIKWTNEVDFSQTRKATVLIYPDPYGRIRPRVITDNNPSESNAPSTEVPR
jgi:hypothetical protein